MEKHKEYIKNIFETQYQNELTEKQNIYLSLNPILVGITILFGGVSFLIKEILEFFSIIIPFTTNWFFKLVIIFSLCLLVFYIYKSVYLLFKVISNHTYAYVPDADTQMERYKEMGKYYENTIAGCNKNQKIDNKILKDIEDDYIKNLSRCTSENKDTNSLRFYNRVMAYKNLFYAILTFSFVTIMVMSYNEFLSNVEGQMSKKDSKPNIQDSQKPTSPKKDDNSANSSGFRQNALSKPKFADIQYVTEGLNPEIKSGHKRPASYHKG